MRKPLASFLFFDSNLETVPISYSGLPYLIRLAKRYGKRPEEMLLDRAVHHFILKKMPDAFRRGRPDIVHLSILSIADAPAYREGFVSFVLHTIRNLVIAPQTVWRPPRNYNNFLSLFEQLLKDKSVPPGGKAILVAREGDLGDALELLRPERVVLFSSRGRSVDLRQFFGNASYEGCVYLIGAYARGEPSKSVLDAADEVISIYPKVLSSWVVASRAVYELERVITSDFAH